MAPRKRRLTRAEIIQALTRLGQLCEESSTTVEVAIYGGAAMMFAFDQRNATKDIDAVFRPVEVVEPMIAEVARELDLPADWMNNGIKEFLGKKEELAPFAELSIPGLIVTRPSAEYLLAMKCLATRLPTPFRAGDLDDLRFLLQRLRISSIKQVDAIVAQFYGGRALENGKRWLVEKLIDEISPRKRPSK